MKYPDCSISTVEFELKVKKFKYILPNLYYLVQTKPKYKLCIKYLWRFILHWIVYCVSFGIIKLFKTNNDYFHKKYCNGG